jgi:HNH endonuclease
MITGLRKKLMDFLTQRGVDCRGMTNRELRSWVIPMLGIEPRMRRTELDYFINGRLTANQAGSPPWEGNSALPPPPKSKDKSANFYETDAWRTVRYKALKLNGGCCQCCGARAAANKPLHVDHIKPRSKYPHLELELSNLQVLCKDCNLGKGARDKTDWRPRSCSSSVI